MGFPRLVVEKSYFDRELKALILRQLEPDMNSFPPKLPVAIRCNRNLKFLLTGANCLRICVYVFSYQFKGDNMKVEDYMNIFSAALKT